MYLAFKESILEDGGESPSELVLYKKFFEEHPYALGIETETKRESIRKKIKPDMEQINNALIDLVKFINDVKDNASPVVLKLLLLISYLPEIFKAYDFRKSGGPGNTKMFKLLMRDYVDYVWYDILPSIWKNFVQDYKDFAKRLLDWFTGPTVRTYMQNLPLTISGVKKEKFTQEEFQDLPPHAKPGDTIETFGFLKPLIQLPKFFMLLVDVAKALATAVTNPLKAFRILLGLIIGTIIYIGYSIISMFTAVFMVPAFIYILLYKIYQSAWWVLMFIIIALIYIVLWLLDYATGGAILPLFRCENLPTMWFTQPGYWFGNKYIKGIFCSSPCSKRFLPSSPGTTWCDRKDNQQPAFCPQQLIYQYYNALLTESPPVTETIRSNPIYAFKPDHAYHVKSEVEQKAIVDAFTVNKFKYLEKCYAGSKNYKSVNSILPYDNFNNREKFRPAQEVYNTFSLSVCNRLPEFENKYGKDSKYVKILQQLCRETYCRYNYDKDFKEGTYTFCEDKDNAVPDDSNYTVDPDESSTLIKFAVLLVFLTITISVISIVYTSTTERTIDYTKPFQFTQLRQYLEVKQGA